LLSEVDENHVYTITPTSENGLPEFIFFPNSGLVKIMVMQWVITHGKA
jgi:hypothetical protein